MTKIRRKWFYETGPWFMCVTGTPFNYWWGAQSSIRGILSEGFFVHMIGGILSTLQNLQGGFCPPCQKLQGVLCSPCKNLRGVSSTYAKMSRGCYVRGVFCPDTDFNKESKSEKKKKIVGLKVGGGGHCIQNSKQGCQRGKIQNSNHLHNVKHVVHHHHHRIFD